MSRSEEFSRGITSDTWSFDVLHATHDEVKAGNHAARRSHVVISRKEYPGYEDASSLAAQMTTAVHGTMPTKVMPRC